MNDETSLTIKNIDNFISSKYKTLSKQKKDFILIFFQTNSLATTKNYLNIPIEEVVNFYKDPLIQEVLRMLQLQRHREIFKMKMLNLEEIGSYLSNQLLDLNVAESDRFSPKEKLEATRLLLDIHTKINNSLQNPIELNSYQVLDMNFKDLSISTIKSLLHSKPDIDKSNNNLINKQESESSNKSLNFNEFNSFIESNNANNFLKKDSNEENLEILDKVSKNNNIQVAKNKIEKLKDAKKVIKQN